jgi:hypothetical protein
MPQCLGHVLGSQGPIGSPSICILFGNGSPASQSASSIPPTLDPTKDNLVSCSIGSLYIDFATPALYFKNSVASAANPNGGWTAITIP